MTTKYSLLTVVNGKVQLHLKVDKLETSNIQEFIIH